MEWYEVKNVGLIDSPALLVYPERIRHNIRFMIETVKGEAHRLIPHVKTHKMKEIVRLQMDAGIARFKCATIAELEMCLEEGAKFVLMAYPLVGPKIERFIALKKKYPDAMIASLVDHPGAAEALSAAFASHGLTAHVYFDVNNGQNRTGHPLDKNIVNDILSLKSLKNLKLEGLHVYDGHVRNASLEERKNLSDKSFQPIYPLLKQLEDAGLHHEVITCGSNSFNPAAQRQDVYCSPGTTLLWDWGYANLIPEVKAQWAAILLTRIISKPGPGMITIDLGHKSVAAENEIDKRVHFLNLPDARPLGQSEEHLVLEVKNWDRLQVGDVLYGIPYHVCPTVALYDEAQVIENNERTDVWNVVARKRKITV